jgi:hypothetical protein
LAVVPAHPAAALIILLLSRTLYGRLANLDTKKSEDDLSINHEENEDEDGSGSSVGEGSVKDMMVDRLRNLTHLSTISENQNSPYSTTPNSRRNSRPYLTAEGLFTPEGRDNSLIPNGSVASAAAAAAAAAVAAHNDKNSSFYASGSEGGNAYYALHNESSSSE